MAMKILIADDNEINRKLIKVILAGLECETIEALNGVQAVDHARRHMPHLILMDIQLPVMDGIKAMTMIKADLLTAQIPVIALTSLAMKGDKEKLLGEGFDGYISKPIDVTEFIELIKGYI